MVIVALFLWFQAYPIDYKEVDPHGFAWLRLGSLAPLFGLGLGLVCTCSPEHRLHASGLMISTPLNRPCPTISPMCDLFLNLEISNLQSSIRCRLLNLEYLESEPPSLPTAVARPVAGPFTLYSHLSLHPSLPPFVSQCDHGLPQGYTKVKSFFWR